MIQLLPNEVILHIAAEVDSPRDLSALLRVNRRFHYTLDDFLYLQSALRWGNPALLWAAELGKIATADKALGAGGDINAREAPLRKSLIPRRLRCHRDKYKTDRCNHGCNTALMLAMDAGHYEMVKYLLAVEGRDITSKNACDFHPLQAAVFLGDTAMVKLFLQLEDAEPELAGWELMTPLMTAAMKGHVDVVKLLLACPDVDPSKGNAYTKSPMFLVAWHGYGEIAKLLLAAGASPNRYFDVFPLEMAVNRGYTDVVRHLLDAGAVPESTSPAGILHDAARCNHLGVFKVILERFPDVDINFKNNSRQTALWYAARYGQEEMVSLLLSHDGIEVNGDYAIGTPVETIRRLRRDQLLDHPEVSEPTVLIVAAMQGYKNIVKMLVDVEGIELDAVNLLGETAMEAAYANGHSDTAEVIRAAMEARATQGLKTFFR
ncbi:unnamed protein product [Clonostachys rosea f. rosea IK726]|jgi:ankyrin repeat protein|uniref:Uncharacterized protein n=1 Tax=Clonostachys rosea f. rosea IK726 TaxID=1349383 RepID=A0ACA9U0U1_BIOOC|nr:unnamed protein product [Clonostachys rosea f. rosea IK726]